MKQHGDDIPRGILKTRERYQAKLKEEYAKKKQRVRKIKKVLVKTVAKLSDDNDHTSKKRVLKNMKRC